MVTVRAPATSANLGSGYDVFGIALERPADVIRVQRAPETTITVTGAGSRYIPEDPDKNVVGAVAEALDAPAAIQLDKGVRTSSGLGSSAASAAGVAVALNELYDRGRSRRELVEAAAAGEAVAAGTAHADNVAPALLGGFTIVGSDPERGIRTVEGTSAALPIVVCLPDVAISTDRARDVVPDSVSMTDHVRTVSNAAALTLGMCRNSHRLVGAGLDDPIVTPARAELIEGYNEVREAALNAGATGVTVSGAGPSILAIPSPGRSRAVAGAMIDGFDASGVDARAYQTRIGNGVSFL